MESTAPRRVVPPVGDAPYPPGFSPYTSRYPTGSAPVPGGYPVPPIPGTIPGSSGFPPAPMPGPIPGSSGYPSAPMPGAIPGSSGYPHSAIPGSVPGSSGFSPTPTPGAIPVSQEHIVPGPDAVPIITGMSPVEINQMHAFLKARKIETLIHFTRLENLASILSYGLLSRAAIETDSRIDRVRFNEPALPEAWQGMISLNVSFPNYRLFYNMQFQRGHEWIVLVYDAELLLAQPFFSFLFPAHNLIRTPIFATEIAPNLQTFDAFENLFRDTDTVRRVILGIPDSYPTHPHSEILTPQPVQNQYLREVHFYNEYKFNQWSLQNRSLASIIDKNLWQIGLEYFSPRFDYANWRTTLR